MVNANAAIANVHTNTAESWKLFSFGDDVFSSAKDNTNVSYHLRSSYTIRYACSVPYKCKAHFTKKLVQPVFIMYPTQFASIKPFFLLNHSTSTLGYQVIHFIQEFVEFYNFYFDIFKIIESQFSTKAP